MATQHNAVITTRFGDINREKSEDRHMATQCVSVPPCCDFLFKREWSSGIASDTENILATKLIPLAIPTGNFQAQ